MWIFFRIFSHIYGELERGAAMDFNKMLANDRVKPYLLKVRYGIEKRKPSSGFIGKFS